MKFGIVMHTGTPNDTVYQKRKNLKIPDGGRISIHLSLRPEVTHSLLTTAAVLVSVGGRAL